MSTKSRLRLGYERARREGRGIEPGFGDRPKPPAPPKKPNPIRRVADAVDPAGRRIRAMKPQIEERQKLNRAARADKKLFGRTTIATEVDMKRMKRPKYK